jgi:hypothetical protein
VRCDFPEYLQLSSYIAQQEGFRLDADSPSASAAKAEWRAWWESLFIPPATHIAIHPDRNNPWLRVNYDPPGFTRLAHWPAVQVLCRQHFPTFHRHWGTVGGEKEPMSRRMSEQLQRVRMERIVKACAAVAGKRESAPFDLTVNFVLWPDDFHRVISDTYLVLGRQFLDVERVVALRAILQEFIARLV